MKTTKSLRLGSRLALLLVLAALLAPLGRAEASSALQWAWFDPGDGAYTPNVSWSSGPR